MFLQITQYLPVRNSGGTIVAARKGTFRVDDRDNVFRVSYVGGGTVYTAGGWLVQVVVDTGLRGSKHQYPGTQRGLHSQIYSEKQSECERKSDYLVEQGVPRSKATPCYTKAMDTVL